MLSSRHRFSRLLFVAAILLLTSVCAGPFAPKATPMGPEAFCATLPDTGYGHAFYCGTSLASLDKVNFPDGSHGFCMYADTNLSLVGYVAYTSNGGAFPVTTQSNASDICRQLGNMCPGYIRCTRQ